MTQRLLTEEKGSHNSNLFYRKIVFAVVGSGYADNYPQKCPLSQRNPEYYSSKASASSYEEGKGEGST
jgi:hypothetical protein